MQYVVFYKGGVFPAFMLFQKRLGVAYVLLILTKTSKKTTKWIKALRLRSNHTEHAHLTSLPWSGLQAFSREIGSHEDTWTRRAEALQWTKWELELPARTRSPFISRAIGKSWKVHKNVHANTIRICCEIV